MEFCIALAIAALASSTLSGLTLRIPAVLRRVPANIG